ncbi:ribosomal protein S18 acetylase RimI-like enzyme [Kribbella aluminosa]|uniref:Ribosomal protein S18 acetylase RimI-like enzyme n=1 Tax=Kribbella aluminosa TaxID=416017 RepID=A0ABS4UZX7_9ACTN|nr:GNAT family N-acetyltransferase [Kribbella aluminosa]MBP2357202.1 ribosomal protein S18 acetylase RimI-like enzyme [Kribbella aluminosa]
MIRRAELSDVDAVRAIGVRTWPVAYGGLVADGFITDGLAQWWSRETVERGITTGVTLVAEDGDELVGMTGLGRQGDFWVMWKLYVLPGHQGRGIGKALLDAAVAALPEGTPELLLDVLVTNEKAIGFYRSQGFGEPRRVPDRELGDDLMWMSLDLDRT